MDEPKEQPTEQFIKHFWSRVDKPGSDVCWQFPFKTSGRPTIWFGGKHIGAHRFVFWITTGIWPGDLYVLHNCDNPLCIRPSHLWLGTNRDNMHDSAVKNRIAFGEGHGMHKLTEAMVCEIRARYAAGDISTTQLAKDYPVRQETIAHVIRRKTWKRVI